MIEATWALAIATFALVLWTIFGERILNWHRRAKLTIAFEMKPPDCIELPFNEFRPNGELIYSADSYYVRFRVINTGTEPALDVEAYIAEVEKKEEHGDYVVMDSFIPLNLRWAVETEDTSAFYPRITRGLPKHCNLGHIIEPSDREHWRPVEDPASLGIDDSTTVFSLDTITKPSSLSHLLPPASYKITIVVSADNARAVEKHIAIEMDGKWHKKNNGMWGAGISVVLLD